MDPTGHSAEQDFWLRQFNDRHTPTQIITGGGAEAPGFHDLALPELCRDSDHGMPTHLHIPGGTKYVHYCPSCRHKSVAYGIVITC